MYLVEVFAVGLNHFLVTVEGIAKLVRLVQFSKAIDPIAVIVSGSEMLVRLEQS